MLANKRRLLLGTSRVDEHLPMVQTLGLPASSTVTQRLHNARSWTKRYCLWEFHMMFFSLCFLLHRPWAKSGPAFHSICKEKTTRHFNQLGGTINAGGKGISKQQPSRDPTSAFTAFNPAPQLRIHAPSCHTCSPSPAPAQSLQHHNAHTHARCAQPHCTTAFHAAPQSSRPTLALQHLRPNLSSHEYVHPATQRQLLALILQL